nr:hypothetical protein [Gordonia sp. NB41Y]
MSRDRGRRMRRTGVIAVAALAVTVVAACGVDGRAVPAREDLSPLAATGDDFPVPGATRVPQPAVGFALGGLTGSDPAAVDPADCTPPTLDPTGAVVLQVIPAGGPQSFTAAVAYSDDDLSSVDDQARRCARYTVGGGQMVVHVGTDVYDPGLSGVATTEIVREVTSDAPGAGAETQVKSRTLIGQRGSVRVYAQQRWPGTEVPPASDLDSLFTVAVTRAFG